MANRTNGRSPAQERRNKLENRMKWKKQQISMDVRDGISSSFERAAMQREEGEREKKERTGGNAIKVP